MAIARFFARPLGRGLRVALGLGLIVWAVLVPHLWWLAVVGAAFVVLGVANVCLLAPLAGGPLRGRLAR
jgi:hypothetical protein